MSDWDPDQYRRFATERAQPFWDLIELVDLSTVDRMVDLGCGDGALSVQPPRGLVRRRWSASIRRRPCSTAPQASNYRTG